MKFVCPVCGYVYEGDAAPEKCPQCGVPGSKFTVIDDNGSKLVFADEHKIGVGRLEGVPEEIVEGLRANFTGECTEVGMYLAMARAAHREGYPEVGLYYEKAAWEEAEHAAKFAELLGEVVSPSTKENLTKRVEAEHGATAGKLDLAKKAKALNLDAIHDTVHEMAKGAALFVLLRQAENLKLKSRSNSDLKIKKRLNSAPFNYGSYLFHAARTVILS